MYARISAEPVSARTRVARHVGAALAGVALAGGLVACESGAASTPLAPEVRRNAPGVDRTAPADSIEEQIHRYRSELDGGAPRAAGGNWRFN